MYKCFGVSLPLIQRFGTISMVLRIPWAITTLKRFCAATQPCLTPEVFENGLDTVLSCDRDMGSVVKGPDSPLTDSSRKIVDYAEKSTI